MTGHDEMLDTVAAYALGVLSEDEQREVSEHLRDCAACAEEYRQLRPAVSALAGAAEGCSLQNAPGPSPLLKARIMRQVRRRANPPAAAWLLPAAAACLIAALLAGAGDLVLGRHVRRLEQAMAQRDAIVRELLAEGTQRYPFAGGEVLRRGARLYLAMRGLPQPPDGKVYQAWTLRAGAKRMQPSLTFLPSSSGIAVLSLPVDARNLVAVAVSVEPRGGSSQPTSAPVALVHLRG